MVLQHNVDLTNEVVFARLTMTQTAIEKETAHVVDCFDGMYGVGGQVLQSVKITKDRFRDLFYSEAVRGECEFVIAEKSPELVLRAGGYQVAAYVSKSTGAADYVTSADMASTDLNTKSTQFLACVDEQADYIHLARAVASGGRGWKTHYDISFDVIEIVTQNLEDDLKLERDCWDECSYIRMRGVVADSLDLAEYFDQCKSAEKCVLSSEELANILNSQAGEGVGSERTSLSPVKVGDKLAFEVEYKNGNEQANSTVLRLHFVIAEDDTSLKGYNQKLVQRFRVPMLAGGKGRPIVWGTGYSASFSELVGEGALGLIGLGLVSSSSSATDASLNLISDDTEVRAASDAYTRVALTFVDGILGGGDDDALSTVKSSASYGDNLGYKTITTDADGKQIVTYDQSGNAGKIQVKIPQLDEANRGVVNFDISAGQCANFTLNLNGPALADKMLLERGPALVDAALTSDSTKSVADVGRSHAPFRLGDSGSNLTVNARQYQMGNGATDSSMLMTSHSTGANTLANGGRTFADVFGSITEPVVPKGGVVLQGATYGGTPEVLTINAGTVVKMRGMLVVPAGATLNVQGTVANPVRFENWDVCGNPTGVVIFNGSNDPTINTRRWVDSSNHGGSQGTFTGFMRALGGGAKEGTQKPDGTYMSVGAGTGDVSWSYSTVVIGAGKSRMCNVELHGLGSALEQVPSLTVVGGTNDLHHLQNVSVFDSKYEGVRINDGSLNVSVLTVRDAASTFLKLDQGYSGRTSHLNFYLNGKYSKYDALVEQGDLTSGTSAALTQGPEKIRADVSNVRVFVDNCFATTLASGSLNSNAFRRLSTTAGDLSVNDVLSAASTNTYVGNYGVGANNTNQYLFNNAETNIVTEFNDDTAPRILRKTINTNFDGGNSSDVSFGSHIIFRAGALVPLNGSLRINPGARLSMLGTVSDPVHVMRGGLSNDRTSFADSTASIPAILVVDGSDGFQSKDNYSNTLYSNSNIAYGDASGFDLPHGSGQKGWERLGGAGTLSLRSGRLAGGDNSLNNVVLHGLGDTTKGVPALSLLGLRPWDTCANSTYSVGNSFENVTIINSQSDALALIDGSLVINNLVLRDAVRDYVTADLCGAPHIHGLRTESTNWRVRTHDSLLEVGNRSGTSTNAQRSGFGASLEVVDLRPVLNGQSRAYRSDATTAVDIAKFLPENFLMGSFNVGASSDMIVNDKEGTVDTSLTRVHIVTKTVTDGSFLFEVLPINPVGSTFADASFNYSDTDASMNSGSSVGSKGRTGVTVAFGANNRDTNEFRKSVWETAVNLGRMMAVTSSKAAAWDGTGVGIPKGGGWKNAPTSKDHASVPGDHFGHVEIIRSWGVDASSDGQGAGAGSHSVLISNSATDLCAGSYPLLGDNVQIKVHHRYSGRPSKSSGMTDATARSLGVAESDVSLADVRFVTKGDAELNLQKSLADASLVTGIVHGSYKRGTNSADFEAHSDFSHNRLAILPVAELTVAQLYRRMQSDASGDDFPFGGSDDDPSLNGLLSRFFTFETPSASSSEVSENHEYDVNSLILNAKFAGKLDGVFRLQDNYSVKATDSASSKEYLVYKNSDVVLTGQGVRDYISTNDEAYHGRAIRLTASTNSSTNGKDVKYFWRESAAGYTVDGLTTAAQLHEVAAKIVAEARGSPSSVLTSVGNVYRHNYSSGTQVLSNTRPNDLLSKCTAWRVTVPDANDPEGGSNFPEIDFLFKPSELLLLNPTNGSETASAQSVDDTRAVVDHNNEWGVLSEEWSNLFANTIPLGVIAADASANYGPVNYKVLQGADASFSSGSGSHTHSDLKLGTALNETTSDGDVYRYGFALEIKHTEAQNDAGTITITGKNVAGQAQTEILPIESFQENHPNGATAPASKDDLSTHTDYSQKLFNVIDSIVTSVPLEKVSISRLAGSSISSEQPAKKVEKFSNDPHCTYSEV